MLAFVLGVSVTTGVVFGLAPALRATAMNVSATLKESSRSVAGSRSLLSKALLVVQVAISLVLLIAAGLFLRTLQNLRNVDVGFNTRNLVLFRVSPALNRYDEPRTFALYQQMRAAQGRRRRALGGAVANVQLLSGSVNSTSIFVQGRTYAQGQRDSINRLVMSPGYFETMEMPLRAGRGFTDRDDQKAPKVAIINETAARKYFPNENPIGQHIGSSVETRRADRDRRHPARRQVRQRPRRRAADDVRAVPAVAAAQRRSSVRTAGDPAGAAGAIREVVRQLDPESVADWNVSTQVEQVEKRLQQERVFAQAYAMFGALALLLASIGLFGLMSYSVARRTNEIGIRMALGAQRRDVLRLVMGESMTLVVIGVGLGLAAALAASRLVVTLVFGLAATDAVTMLTAMIGADRGVRARRLPARAPRGASRSAGGVALRVAILIVPSPWRRSSRRTPRARRRPTARCSDCRPTLSRAA